MTVVGKTADIYALLRARIIAVLGADLVPIADRPHAQVGNAMITASPVMGQDQTGGAWWKALASNDDVYVQPSNGLIAGSAQVKLSGRYVPAVHTGHVLSGRINFTRVDPAAGAFGQFSINQGFAGPQVYSSPLVGRVVPAGSAVVDFTLTLSEAAAAQITDYSDLWLFLAAQTNPGNTDQAHAFTRFDAVRLAVPSVIGERVYDVQAPDNVTFPYVTVRILNRDQSPEYRGDRELWNVEVQVFARPRAKLLVAEAIADAIDEAFLRWFDQSVGLIFCWGDRSRTTFPAFDAPADREVCQARMVYNMVVWPGYLTRHGNEDT